MRPSIAHLVMAAAIAGFFIAAGCTYKSDTDPKPPVAWSPLPPGAEDYTGPDHVALVEYTSAFG